MCHTNMTHGNPFTSTIPQRQLPPTLYFPEKLTQPYTSYTFEFTWSTSILKTLNNNFNMFKIIILISKFVMNKKQVKPAVLS